MNENTISPYPVEKFSSFKVYHLTTASLTKKGCILAGVAWVGALT